MKQLLWIGCLESDEEFKRKAQKGYDLASAQVSQKNILMGVEAVTGLKFDSINGSVLPPYPIYKDRLIQPVIWGHKEDTWNISVGYINDRYVNRLNCKKSMLHEVEKWIANRYKGEELIVFVYSMRSSPMAAACKIKKLIPCAKIYLIVTDLPRFMDLGQSKLKALLKKIDWVLIKRMQKNFDGFILYTSTMAEYLKIESTKWMLMEGSYEAKESAIGTVFEKKRAIMYSGKLDKEYGLEMLVNAFMKIEDDSLELWLTGGGNSVEYIKKCAEMDKRIKFYGFLPKREDVLHKQRSASLLLNMRLPSEASSNFCFPSKLFEYMVTGIPVLTFQIGGIPEEYYKFLYLVEDETEEKLILAIKSIMALNEVELRQKGFAARSFILEKKTSIEQAKRIVNFVGVQ